MTTTSFQPDHLEEIISLAQKIKEARTHMYALIDEWNKKFPKMNIEPSDYHLPSQPVPTPQISTAGFDSIDDLIVHHIDENPNRDFNVNLLHAELNVPPASLGTQLSRLFRTGRIERLGRGYYHSKNRRKS
jgi:hypothetical protein